MKTQKAQVQEIIRREFLGHPSREDEGRISNLEVIVLQLAEQIDVLRFELKSRGGEQQMWRDIQERERDDK